MAKRQVAARRRSAIALVLIGFVLMTTGVIARRVAGVRQQREIRDLNRKREALESERIKLEAAIRDASSRARLQPIAERRLNMHIPASGQQIILKHPSRAPRVQNDSL